MTVLLPQVHVSIQPVAYNVWARSSGTAAHDDDDHRLHGLHLEGQCQGKGWERHDAELAQEADDDAPGSPEVAQQFWGVHSAAHGKHDQGEHDGEHCAQHQAQHLIEVAWRNEAVCARADCGERLTATGYRGRHGGLCFGGRGGETGGPDWGNASVS